MSDTTEVKEEKKYLLLVRMQSFGQDSSSVLLCQVGNDDRTAMDTAKEHLAPYGTMDVIDLGIADDLLEPGVLLRNGVTPHHYNSNHLYGFNNELKPWNDSDLVDEYRLKKYGPRWHETPDPSNRSSRAWVPPSLIDYLNNPPPTNNNYELPSYSDDASVLTTKPPDFFIKCDTNLWEYIGDLSQDVLECSYNEDHIRLIWNEGRLDGEVAEMLKTYHWRLEHWRREDGRYQDQMTALVKLAGGWTADWGPEVSPLTETEQAMIDAFQYDIVVLPKSDNVKKE